MKVSFLFNILGTTRNCTGPQTINAANVGSIKDLINQKNVKTNDRLQG